MTDKKTEQTDLEAYDMGEHFKAEHEKLTKNISHLEREVKFYKKEIMMNYSLIRLLDEAFTDCELDKVFHLQHLIDLMRAKNSEIIDRYIFNKECPVCGSDDNDSDSD